MRTAPQYARDQPGLQPFSWRHRRLKGPDCAAHLAKTERELSGERRIHRASGEGAERDTDDELGRRMAMKMDA